MLISDTATLAFELRKPGLLTVLFLTPDYPLTTELEKIIDDPSILVFDLTEKTIDEVRVIKIPQIRFYESGIIRGTLVGNDVIRWRTEYSAINSKLKKQNEVQNEQRVSNKSSLPKGRSVSTGKKTAPRLSRSLRSTFFEN